MTALRLATRGSKLAVAQTETVAQMLRERNHEVEIVPVNRDGSPDPTGGPGGDKARFVRTVEAALLDDRADVGVHSAKDLPTDEVNEELEIAAVPPRVRTADSWLGTADVDSIDAVPRGLKVGTASLRRRSQILALRPDLEVWDLRGNIDTRIGKLQAGDYDAIVLAHAGLLRLGRAELIGFDVPEEQMLPAAGQGALALQVRLDDAQACKALESINDLQALCELRAERELVRTLGADCDSPVAARCRARGNDLELRAFVGMADGSSWIRDQGTGDADDPESLGRDIALRLNAAGAAEILHRS